MKLKDTAVKNKEVICPDFIEVVRYCFGTLVINRFSSVKRFLLSAFIVSFLFQKNTLLVTLVNRRRPFWKKIRVFIFYNVKRAVVDVRLLRLNPAFKPLLLSVLKREPLDLDKRKIHRGLFLCVLFGRNKTKLF